MGPEGPEGGGGGGGGESCTRTEETAPPCLEINFLEISGWMEGGGGGSRAIFFEDWPSWAVWVFFCLFWSGFRQSQCTCASPHLGWEVQKIMFGEGWDSGRAVRGQNYEKMG